MVSRGGFTSLFSPNKHHRPKSPQYKFFSKFTAYPHEISINIGNQRLPFLQTPDARRLLNVALSRAQAKVLLYLSDADAASPLLAPLVQRLRLAGDRRAVIPLQVLAAAPEFPRNALGLRVSAGRVTGEVQRLSPDGRQLWLVNERNGAALPLDAAFWRAKAGLAS